jgi:hypothetical protein
MPSEKKIIAVVNNRNMADILRTVAHEMVHHMQNLDGRLNPKSGEDGSPDENEANSLAGVIMREFGRKTHTYMSKYSLYNLMIEDIRKAYNVYVDMDGVLTDFERRFEQFAGVTPDEFTAQKTIEFGKAKADEQFWDL